MLYKQRLLFRYIYHLTHNQDCLGEGGELDLRIGDLGVEMAPNSDYDHSDEEETPRSDVEESDESGSDEDAHPFDSDPPEPKQVQWWMVNFGQ